MPSANKEGTPVALDEDVIEGRYAELDGYTVGFETFRQDANRTSALREGGGTATRNLSRFWDAHLIWWEARGVDLPKSGGRGEPSPMRFDLLVVRN